MQTTQRKAKRKLSNISFEHDGAHVALVSKDQQGPANGHDYALVMKASKFSDEFVNKASKIKVELDIVEYLQRFYHIYDLDAEILARTLGFKTKRQEKYELELKEKQLEDQEQMIDPEYPEWDAEEKEYEDYINSKVASIDIMKSLHEAESVPEVLASLNEDEYLQLLQDQQMLEKAFKKIDKAQKESKTVASKKAVVQDTSPASEVQIEEVSTSVIKKKESETMTQEVKTVEQEITVEMVEKSALESVQKALEDQKVALAKAMETIQQFEAEKKAAVEKQRLADVKAAIKDEAHAETIFKAVKEAADADFEAVVKALSAIAAATEQSDLFIEKGATVEDAPVNKESAVEKLLKAKFQSK